MQREQKKESDESNESVEDDLPPLEQIESTKVDDSKAPSPERAD